MTYRTGQANLIRRLRGMAQVGTADYSIVLGDGSTAVWWSDNYLADVLDAYRRDYQGVTLSPAPEYTGGTTRYFNYYAPDHNWEEANSGSVYWLVTDSLGADPGTANYTVDYIKGEIRFSADRGGTAYMLTGRTYNLNAAAAQLWREKAGNTAAFYSFQTDNQSFTRSDWHKHCLEMAKYYDAEAGFRSTRLKRDDLYPAGAGTVWHRQGNTKGFDY